MDLRDNRAFKTFYLQYFKTITNFCNGYLKDVEIARDVAQESFFRLYQNRAQTYSEEYARTWLYMVARNICVDHLRRQKFQSGDLTDIPETFLSDNYFLDQITQQEVIQNIQTAINSLSEQTRKITLLSLQGKSNAEIAETLNISVNSVKTLKKLAYKKLRDILKNEYVLFLLTGFF